MGSPAQWLTTKIDRKKAKFGRWLRYNWLLWRKEREFRNDRNYNLNLVEKGFLDRRADAGDDKALLSRIIKAYKLAKESQHGVSPSYQVSNEWVPIYNHQLGEVMRALQSEDVVALGSIYENFWRNSCSAGLIGLSLDMQKYFFSGSIKKLHKKIFLFDTLHRFNLWKSLLGNTHDVKALESPSIGNPFGYFLDGHFIKAGSDYLHYYATLIERLTRRTGGRRVVVELGGGFGGMAYYLARDNDNLTYLDFDLPENMALTAYYLLKAFPEKKTVLYGESDLSTDCINSNDIILMPNFELPKLPDNSADLIFNSYSLAEMSAEAIRNYIAEFTRIARQYLLHVNHTKQCLVGADEFGINPEWFDLLYKVPALWNAGRNPDTDEYEYLYKKIDG